MAAAGAMVGVVAGEAVDGGMAAVFGTEQTCKFTNS
jgi:hypothetical protein